MITRKRIDINAPLTTEQLAMLDEAATLPIPDNAEYPELTDDQLVQIHRISAERNSARRKGTVTLRLSPAAIARARQLGKGYTSVLSRILEAALADPETIERFL